MLTWIWFAFTSLTIDPFGLVFTSLSWPVYSCFYDVSLSHQNGRNQGLRSQLVKPSNSSCLEHH